MISIRPADVDVASADAGEPLPHERLDAYQTALALDALVVLVCRRAARGHAWLLDQVQRAAGSTVLNLVEANGRTGQDRIQHLRIARGSAFEVDAAFALLEHRSLVKPEERARAHAMTDRLSRMLTGLSKTGR